MFVETVQKRGADVINARKMSSAMSAAKAASDHMRDWFDGTESGKMIYFKVALNLHYLHVPCHGYCIETNKFFE